MEEKLTRQELAEEFMDHFVDALVWNKSHDMKATPLSNFGYASFDGSYLEMGEYRFETHGDDLVVIKNGEEIGKCHNEAYSIDWLFGMAVYLKERNLVDDFKEFYMFA